jgi:RHS repeat-associated protein
VDQAFRNGAATGTAAVRYVHPDHLGSTNVVTNESGALVQTLDYYPYGATRVSVSTSTNEKRKYIGQFYDAESSLSYLNARYYDGNRGQFLSVDPSFLAIGDPNKLKQVTGQDQRTFLFDPQQMNSTSYGRDNPITNKDPLGNYVDVSSSGTYMGWSGAVGVRFDGRGMGFYAEAGFGAGVAGWPVSVAYSPGDYTRNPDGQVTAGGSTMIYGPIGGGVAVSGQYEPRSVSLKDPSASGYAGLGIGAEAYVRKQVGSVDYDWKAPPGLVWDKGSNFSTPNYKSPSIQNMVGSRPTISAQNTLIYNATYTSNGSARTYTTPSGAVVNFNGTLVSGLPKR